MKLASVLSPKLHKLATLSIFMLGAGLYVASGASHAIAQTAIQDWTKVSPETDTFESFEPTAKGKGNIVTAQSDYTFNAVNFGIINSFNSPSPLELHVYAVDSANNITATLATSTNQIDPSDVSTSYQANYKEFISFNLDTEVSFVSGNKYGIILTDAIDDSASETGQWNLAKYTSSPPVGVRENSTQTWSSPNSLGTGNSAHWYPIQLFLSSTSTSPGHASPDGFITWTSPERDSVLPSTQPFTVSATLTNPCFGYLNDVCEYEYRIGSGNIGSNVSTNFEYQDTGILDNTQETIDLAWTVTPPQPPADVITIGTKEVRLVVNNTTTLDHWNPQPAHGLFYFNLDSNSFRDQTGVSVYGANPGTTSTNLYDDLDCSIHEVTCQINKALLFMFRPSQEKIFQLYFDLGTLRAMKPWGYVFHISNSIEQQITAPATTLATVTLPVTFFDNTTQVTILDWAWMDDLFVQIPDTMSLIWSLANMTIWLGFGWWVYKRIIYSFRV
jgi:hypothetical protein